MLTVLKNSGIHVYNSRKLQINSLIFCETLKKKYCFISVCDSYLCVGTNVVCLNNKC